MKKIFYVLFLFPLLFSCEKRDSEIGKYQMELYNGEVFILDTETGSVEKIDMEDVNPRIFK